MDNYEKSVAGVVIKDNKVLLGRHNYGVGNGLLIIPGGYINVGESPEDGVKREILEETGIKVEVNNLIGIRFGAKDWYAIFSCEYVTGEAKVSDNENSEVIWMDINDALNSSDVPDLTKNSIRSAIKNSKLEKTEYVCDREKSPYSYYG